MFVNAVRCQASYASLTDDPLRGMLAILEGPTTPAERVRVLLTMLGHASRAQVSMIELAKASPDLKVPLPKQPRRTRGRGRRTKSGQSLRQS